MRIYRQYQLQYYDSVIVAAALEAGAEVLYLEDMTDGHIVDRTLKIVNPFLH
jgi:predicted nucleic acid-binding protein